MNDGLSSRRSRRILVWLATVLALVLVAAGCGGEEPEPDTAGAPETDPAEPDPDDEDETEPDDGDAPPAESQRIVVGMPAEPDGLDPSLTRTLNGKIVLTALCESLFIPDGDLVLQPLLAAELPEFSDDGRTMTIRLREDATFNDGEPFNADAVVQSLLRHQSIEGSARASDLAAIEDATAVDEFTVELSLSQPDAALTAILAEEAGMIMSPAQTDELGDDFASEPVCVGPFSFVERTAQIVLERSEHYYDADQVHLEELVFTPIEDGSVRVANLLSGEIQIADRLAATDVQTVEDDTRSTVLSAPELGYRGITVNIANADGVGEPPGDIDSPMADDRVREAFELTLDRQVISDVVFNGQVDPGCGPISPASPLFPDVPCSERDVEAAQALLEEAGVDLPVRFEIIMSQGAENVRLAEVIQSMAADAGFELDIRPMDLAAALDASAQGDYDAFMVGWSGRLDADGNLYEFHHTTGVNNVTGATGDEIDALLEQGRVATDVEERTAVYAELVPLIIERRNIVYLHHRTNFVGVDAAVEGFTFTSDGMLRFKGVSFPGR